MRLPDRKKPGDPVMARDWNMLLEAIAARTPCSGSGLKFTASSGGFSYSLPPSKAERARGQAPFSAIGIAVDADAYLVTIKEGWVIERQPIAGDHPAVRFHMPEYDGTALNALPRPEISMNIGDVAKVRYPTDDTGKISGTPTIEITAEGIAPEIVDEEEQEMVTTGVHYQPKDPDSPTAGVDGDYYVPLFKLDLDADGVPMITPYQQSDIEHWAQLWTGENTGYGARVFKEHDEVSNIYKFRSLKGYGGITATEDGDEIKIAFGGGDHLDLFAITLYCTIEDGYIKPSGSTDGYLYRWRHGLYVGQFSVMSGPLPGDAGLVIVTQHLTHLGFS